MRAIVSGRPWDRALPASERVVIPGYAHLRAFSAAEEAAVKKGLGGPVGTWFHWTNWRVIMPVSRGHQADVATEVAGELDAGRLVQLLVTNWPIPELNHDVNGAVILEALRARARAGGTVVVVTHRPDVARGASAVLALREGRLHKEDPV